MTLSLDGAAAELGFITIESDPTAPLVISATDQESPPWGMVFDGGRYELGLTPYDYDPTRGMVLTGVQSISISLS